jgi:hypothetical protein
MQRFIRLKNIDLYRRMLDADPSDSLRQALLQLVAKEQGMDPPTPRVKAQDLSLFCSASQFSTVITTSSRQRPSRE